jgi:hypothetical protein
MKMLETRDGYSVGVYEVEERAIQFSERRRTAKVSGALRWEDNIG